MNKGFIKLSVLFTGVLALIGVVGYLVSAKNVEASLSGFTASEWSQYCSENPTICNKDETGFEYPLGPDSTVFYVECSEGQTLDFASVHAGDGQDVYELPHEGFEFYYVDTAIYVWRTEHPHAISWLIGLCSDNEQPTPTPTEVPTPTPTEVPSPTPTPEEKTHVCLDEEALNFDEDFDEEKEVGDIEVCEYEEVTPTPTPTETPREPEQPQGPFGAPQCEDTTPLVLPSNVHVIRNGADATVNFFTSSSNANIYYRISGTEGWQHALRDIPVTGGYVSVTIHDLNPTGDYDFGIQSSNSCAGGEVVLAVVEDDYQPKTFMFSWWEWLN
jgi:hypothetical protein